MGGRRNGWFAKVDNVSLRLDGFAKVDNRFGYEKWLQGGCIGGRVGLQKLITDLDMRYGYKGGVRVGFIYIKDMYNNDVGKGGV